MIFNFQISTAAPTPRLSAHPSLPSPFRRMEAAGGYEVIPKPDFCSSRHPRRLFDKHVGFQPGRFHQESPAE